LTAPEIIAFVTLERDPGLASVLSGLASAISTPYNQVALIDETSGEVHLQSGTGEPGYVLIDIPYQPSPSTAAVLAACDLVMIVCSGKLDYIDAAQGIVKGLLSLGIAPEKTAALLVDPRGMLSGAALDGLKTYVEAVLGVAMAGGVSLDPEDPEMSADIFKLAAYLMARTRREEPAAPELPLEISL